MCAFGCMIVNSVHKRDSEIIIALEIAFIYIVVGLENSLRAGRYGDRIVTKTRFSAPVQADPGAHPALCTQGTGLFPEGKAVGKWR
jgi:hypothetical protein